MSITKPNINSAISITRQNIKSVEMMYEYLEKIFVSFQSLHDEFKRFQDELYSFQNDLNFRPMSQQMFVSYNRMIIFLYDRVKGTLSSKFSSYDSTEIQIIKPVRNKKYYCDLEITYNTSDDYDVIVSKPLGTVATVSIDKINDEVMFLHADNVFVFLLFSDYKNDDGSFALTNEDFRKHISDCNDLVKEVISWLYSDMHSIKVVIRSLIDVIEELVKMSPSKCAIEWVQLVKQIQEQITKINNA
jgi:predicted DNA-binding protein YlxM (UPF0122 family)